MEIKQLLFENKLSITNFKSPNNSSYLLLDKNKENSVFFNSSLLITSEPVNSIFGTKELKRTDIEFKELGSYKFIQLKSDSNFYLKLNDTMILTTKIFNYFNYEQKLKISIANSTLKLIDSNFEILPSSKSITINYFLCDFDSNLNINWEKIYA